MALNEKICSTNPKCEKTSKCRYMIILDECENGKPKHFIGGLECPYSSFKKLNVVEIGHTDEPIETTEISEWKSVYDKKPIVRSKE